MSEADRTALIVIDMQKDVVANAHRRAEVIATIAGLVEEARAAGLPVAWVQHHEASLQQGSPDWQLVPELQPPSWSAWACGGWCCAAPRATCASPPP